mmetsp:Transcript_20772/g.53229  ORF Transcript_20772/g.53229 Transcript_20772/m.53229 type:complete len:619 (+) Transcript_20772:542-2398(+)
MGDGVEAIGGAGSRGLDGPSLKEAAARLTDTAKNLSLSDGKEVEPLQKLWLDAWHDPVAGVKAFGNCITTANLFGDGDWRLVVAGFDKTLKVWKGTERKAEHTLLETPIAIVSFVSSPVGSGKDMELPALAVASGSHVYIYRNLRPYYKFVLPPEDIHPEEETVWGNLAAGGDAAESQNQLIALRDGGVTLTQRSSDFIFQDPGAREDFVVHYKGQPLTSSSSVAVLGTVNKSHEEPDSVSCLMVGTESGKLLLLNPTGTAVAKTIALGRGSIPTHMVNTGVLDVEWRTAVACRDGKIYQLKNGELQSVVIELEAPCVGLLRNAKTFIIGCMSNTIHQYQMKGKKTYSVYLPAALVALEAVNTGQRAQTIYAAALGNGEVRLYNEKHLVAVHNVPSPVRVLHFGRYGREDNTLISFLKNGALDIKILPRSAKLDVSGGALGPPAEQDIPLNIPKKTKQYVEQTQRERDQAIDMHRIFQRDLCKLRLSTARAYVKVLTDGQGTISYTTGASLRLKADVSGLGPIFVLKMKIQNTGSKPVLNMPIMLTYNEKLYWAQRNQIMVPLLVPHLEYSFEVELECKDPAAQYTDDLRIVMINSDSSVPILSAVVKMPLSDVPDTE